MKENTRERLIRGDIWIRALYMFLFLFVFSISKVITSFVVIFQFITILFTGSANEPLLKFGNSLSVYFREILEFQTFNTEIRPFPFSPWPDEEPGGEKWLDDDDLDESLEDEIDALESEAEAQEPESSDEDSKEKGPKKKGPNKKDPKEK